MIAAATRTAVDSSSAVQILLMLGGITLVPALLFTVTGFSRILIVLGFVRSGLGTPTAPPARVTVISELSTVAGISVCASWPCPP